MSDTFSATAFIDILVSVKPGDRPGKYIVHTEPPAPLVTESDTVINYQIIDTDGYDIVFTGMAVKPENNNQLSTASVSVSGKLLTFSDANSEKLTLAINLKFKDKDGLEFSHDPQIQNDPHPG